MLNHHADVETLFLSKMKSLKNLIYRFNYPLCNVLSGVESYKLSGIDAISFLDRISTNKIENKLKNNSSKTILTNNKGSIIDILNYKVLDEKNILFTIESNNSKTIEYLKSLIILEDVEIVKNRILSKVSIYSKDKLSDNLNFSSYDFFYQEVLESLYVYEIYVEKKLHESMLSEFQIIDENKKQLIDIHNNKFEFDPKLEKINPLETGLYDYVSFNKGCYVGQEVIARLHNYQKVSRSITKFYSNDKLSINTIFKTKNNISGKIISIVKEDKSYIGLCLVKKKDIDSVSENYILI